MLEEHYRFARSHAPRSYPLLSTSWAILHTERKDDFRGQNVGPVRVQDKLRVPSWVVDGVSAQRRRHGCERGDDDQSVFRERKQKSQNFISMALKYSSNKLLTRSIVRLL